MPAAPPHLSIRLQEAASSCQEIQGPGALARYLAERPLAANERQESLFVDDGKKKNGSPDEPAAPEPPEPDASPFDAGAIPPGTVVGVDMAAADRGDPVPSKPKRKGRKKKGG